jgi:hypothetical protein
MKADDYNIVWKVQATKTWPLSEKEVRIILAGKWSSPSDIDIMSFGNGYADCIVPKPSPENFVDSIGYWEDGEEIKLRVGYMPQADYDRLPEFMGF